MFYIFDWDGTISDSAQKIVSCMQSAAVEVGLPDISHEAVKNIIGLGLPEAIRLLFPGINETQLMRCKDAYSSHFTQQDQVPSSFFPGVMETLHRLRDDKYTLAVATGKSRRGLDRVLNNLGMTEFFHYSRCADETTSKPDPHMLRELTDQAGIPVSQSVMVGDTEWDMRMADNISMPKIAVGYGAHSKARLLETEPDMYLDEFQGILKWQFS